MALIVSVSGFINIESTSLVYPYLLSLLYGFILKVVTTRSSSLFFFCTGSFYKFVYKPNKRHEVKYSGFELSALRFGTTLGDLAANET